jgi:hypothetical protein
VGNDVYGQIRHMHKPTMTFYRYTRYSDLTPQEIGYFLFTNQKTKLKALSAGHFKKCDKNTAIVTDRFRLLEIN